MTEENKTTVCTIQSIQDVRPSKNYPPRWLITYHDGFLPGWLHMVHHEAISHRIAEYGFDPNDIDTILNVILYEKHMDHLHEGHPKFLLNTDTDTAREHHLSQMEELKKKIVYTDPDNHLEKIRQAHDPNDPEHHRLRKEFLARHKGARPA
jgi:hypothetical protein